MLSIALCTYNGERFLPEQLESILAQTRQPDELVACDDCSTDNTLEILQNFKKRAPFPVHIVKNQTNLKVLKNFEKAIELCHGEIIVLSDQDDVWKPHKLAKIEAILNENPDAGYVFSDAEVVDDNLSPLGYGLWESVDFTGRFKNKFTNFRQVECFLEQCFVTGATMGFRAKYKDMVLPFPEMPFWWIHDAWLAAYLSALGAFGVPISEKLILYRQHSGQQLGAAPPKDKKPNKDNENLWEQIKSAVNSRDSFNEEADLLLARAQILMTALETNLSRVERAYTNYELLSKFYTHFINRKKIRSSRFSKKLPLSLRELFSGRYKRFSMSWKSFLSDLIL